MKNIIFLKLDEKLTKVIKKMKVLLKRIAITKEKNFSLNVSKKFKYISLIFSMGVTLFISAFNIGNKANKVGNVENIDLLDNDVTIENLLQDVEIIPNNIAVVEANDNEKIIDNDEIQKNDFNISEDFLNYLQNESFEVESYEINSDIEVMGSEINTYNTYLRKYAKYYHLNEDLVIKIAKNITNDYTIPFVDVIKTKYGNINNQEAEAMIFVNKLYLNGLTLSISDMEINESDLIIDNEIEKLQPDKILSNGKSFQNNVKDVCNVLEIDETYILGIILLESGRLKSDKCVNKNNPAGLKGNDGFMTFPTPEAGIIAVCCNLKRYETKNLTSWEELSGVYVNGSRNKPSYGWIKEVRWFQEDISNNPEKYFGKDEEFDECKKLRYNLK